MSHVVDASVLVAAVADAGPDGTWAESVLAEGALVAPELVLVAEAFELPLATLDLVARLTGRALRLAKR